MKQVKFFDGQDVLLEDLDSLQSRLQDTIKNSSYLFTPGLVKVSGYSTFPKLELESTTTLKVNKLVAFTNTCDIINISSDLTGLSPNSSGILVSGGGVWVTGTSYVYIRYTTAEDTPVEHPVTHVPINTRVNDSYILYCNQTTPLATDIVLGTVIYSGTEITSVTTTAQSLFSISADNSRVTLTATSTSYTSGSSISVQEHMQSIGTGTVSATNPHGLAASDIGIDVEGLTNHQKYLHSNGIVGDDTSTVSSYYPEIHTFGGLSTDYLKIFNISVDERAYANGITITKDTITNLSSGYINIPFVVDATPLDTGYYLVYIDSITSLVTLSEAFTSLANLEASAAYTSKTNIPICSVYWDETAEDLSTTSLVDYRYFISTEVTISDSNKVGISNSIIGNRNHYFFYASYKGGVVSDFTTLPGKTFDIILEGNTFGVTFTATDTTKQRALSRIRTYIAANISNRISDVFFTTSNELVFLSTTTMIVPDFADLGMTYTEVNNSANDPIKGYITNGDIAGLTYVDYDEYGFMNYTDLMYAGNIHRTTVHYGGSGESKGIVFVSEAII